MKLSKAFSAALVAVLREARDVAAAIPPPGAASPADTSARDPLGFTLADVQLTVHLRRDGNLGSRGECIVYLRAIASPGSWTHADVDRVRKLWDDEYLKIRDGSPLSDEGRKWPLPKFTPFRVIAAPVSSLKVGALSSLGGLTFLTDPSRGLILSSDSLSGWASHRGDTWTLATDAEIDSIPGKLNPYQVGLLREHEIFAPIRDRLLATI